MLHTRLIGLSLLALSSLHAHAFDNVARFVNTTSAQSPQVTLGPYLGALHYTWSQNIVPTIVGTVRVTVNQANNSTYSTTIYHTDFENNGTRTLLTRTDTNSAGTVTGAVPGFAANVTVAYPTTVLDGGSSMTWGSMTSLTATGDYTEIETCQGSGPTRLCTADASVTDLGPKGTCCWSTQILTATPSHTPWSSVGPIDTADPSGWLYTLIGFAYQDPYTQLLPAEVSSLWSPQELGQGITYAGCSYTYCGHIASTAPEAAQALQSQAYLLTTERTTISSASATPTSSSTSSTTVPAIKATPTLSQPVSTSPSSDAVTPTRAAGSSAETASSPPTQPATNQATPESDLSGPATSSHAPQSSAVGPTTQASPSTPVIVVGSTSITQRSDSQFVIGSQTLAPGSTITLGEGSSTTEVALHTTGSKIVVQVGQSSSTLVGGSPAAAASGSPKPATPTVIEGVTVSPLTSSSEALLVGSQTLNVGSSITIGSGPSTTIAALRTSGSKTILQVGTVESTLSDEPATNARPAPVTLGGITAVPTSSNLLVIGTQTLAPGSSITVGSGASTTIVALQTTGSETILQIGTTKTTLPTVAGTSPPDVVLGGVTVQPTSSLEYVVGGKTLEPGASITIGSGSSTTVVALLTSGSDTILEVGASKTTLPPNDQGTSAVVLGGVTINPTYTGGVVVGSRTLTVGSSITIGSGSSTTVVVLETSGSQTILEVGTSKTTLTGAATTDIGGYVASGLGGGGSSSTGSPSSTSTGVAHSNKAARTSGIGILEGFIMMLAGLTVLYTTNAI